MKKYREFLEESFNVKSILAKHVKHSKGYGWSPAAEVIDFYGSNSEVVKIDSLKPNDVIVKMALKDAKKMFGMRVSKVKEAELDVSVVDGGNTVIVLLHIMGTTQNGPNTTAIARLGKLKSEYFNTMVDAEGSPALKDAVAEIFE